ncbi:MAG: PaaI family thioesterase [bacterium]|nr:PaaI family thioesterase [bacterium]
MSASPAGGLTLGLAREVLAAQPFSVLLGTRLTAFGDGDAELEIDIRDELRQQDGYLHGGVLAYAADNALTFAGGSALGPAVLTGGFTINYLRPALGRTLRARASTVHAGRRQATCRCDLFALDDEGTATHCATAQGTIVSLSAGR